MWVNDIVLRSRLDQSPASRTHTAIVISEKPLISLIAKKFDAPISGTLSLDNFYGIVQRAVVKNYQLKITEALIQYTVNSRLEKGGAIVDRQ
jgi:hypothetical protein